MKDSYVFYKDQLNTEYKPVFDQIEMYVITQNIDESTMEERLGDLLDIFLSSQEAKKPVQKLVGQDLEQFCKTFCSDFGMKNKIFHVLDSLKSIAWLLVSFSFLDTLWFFLDDEGSQGASFWDSMISLDVPGYLIAIFIMGTIFVMTNILLRHMMFKRKKISMLFMKIIMTIEAIISFVVVYLNLSREGPYLFDCPIWIIFVLSAIYLMSYYFTCGKRIKRNKIKFLDMVKKEAHSEIADVMEKKYEKTNKKSIKKGNGELPFEEFLNKEEKLCQQTEKLKFFYYIFPIIVTIFAYIGTYKIDGFDSKYDALFFIILMLVVEYSILIGIWKIVKNGLIERRAWIQLQRQSIKKTIEN